MTELMTVRLAELVNACSSCVADPFAFGKTLPKTGRVLPFSSCAPCAEQRHNSVEARGGRARRVVTQIVTQLLVTPRHTQGSTALLASRNTNQIALIELRWPAFEHTFILDLDQPTEQLCAGTFGSSHRQVLTGANHCRWLGPAIHSFVAGPPDCCIVVK
jgi:hypothetical protein